MVAMTLKSDEPLTLEELVQRANELLPRYLPAEVDDARMREEVNPRLVRHLTSLGLLDEAGREGREARYGLRHLLQLLVARRLRAQGFTTAAIANAVAGQSDEQLQALLTGEAQLTVQISPAPAASSTPRRDASNEAVEYLRNLARSRSRHADSGRADSGRASPPVSPSPASLYVRKEVRPGLELHIAADFRLPPSPHERDVLLSEILQLLKAAPSAGKTHRRK